MIRYRETPSQSTSRTQPGLRRAGLSDTRRVAPNYAKSARVAIIPSAGSALADPAGVNGNYPGATRVCGGHPCSTSESLPSRARPKRDGSVYPRCGGPRVTPTSSMSPTLRVLRPPLSTPAVALVLTLLLAGCAATDETALQSGATAVGVVHAGGYPRSPNPPDQLFVVPFASLSRAERLMVVTLQGLVAKTKPEIYVLPGQEAYAIWLADIGDRYGVKYEIVDDPWTLLERYADRLSGYLLCDVDIDPRVDNASYSSSVHVATSLAGPTNAVVIDRSVEDRARQAGLSLIADVSDLDEQDLLADHPLAADLRTDMVFEMEERTHWFAAMRDYVVMSNSLIFYDGISRFRRRVLEGLAPDSPVLGWGDSQRSERDFVGQAADLGVYTIAANHGFNMTVYSALPTREVVQTGDEAAHEETDRHYVTFIMSDGDNLQYALAGFRVNGRLFDSPNRGSVTLGWGLPASLVDIAPSVLEWFYANASTGESRDGFVMYGLGGYTYPSRYPDRDLDLHISALDDAMRRSDLSVLALIDDNTPSSGNDHLAVAHAQLNDIAMWDRFTAQPHIEGVVYIPYYPYVVPDGEVVWSNDKPVIPARLVMWEGLADDSDVVTQLNAASRDATSAAGYTVVMVHAWSKSVADVAAVVAQLNAEVAVVTPAELVRTMATLVER